MFRHTNGTKQNVWVARSNRDLAVLAYDWTPYTASNLAQGIDGFSWRLTFGGQEKLGVALRVGQDDNLELIVQDDLRVLTNLCIMLEGHATDA